MGEYNEVLIHCRKTIEAVAHISEQEGYVTKDEKGEKIPNWEKMFGNAEFGDIFGTINRRIYGFTWPGAHTGKSINREDADYALMITHAMANMVIVKFEKEWYK